jgi:hypothetical protein
MRTPVPPKGFIDSRSPTGPSGPVGRPTPDSGMPATIGGGGTGPTGPTRAASSLNPETIKRTEGKSRSGKVHHRIHDRTEEYVYVTRGDLRELLTYGWLHQSLTGVGTFFFSGAFWLLAELLAHQEHFIFTSWMATCIISMIFGAVLASCGIIIFRVKQKKLEHYFPIEDN